MSIQWIEDAFPKEVELLVVENEEEMEDFEYFEIQVWKVTWTGT